MMLTTRLDELGERRIIKEIFGPRYGKEWPDNFGDDCALVTDADALPGRLLVATTDPCPEPVASILGYTDLYYRGWLLATINLSDLAASGATPLGLLTSLILPNDMTVGELTRLLDGIDDCSRASGARVIGGNIKEGKRIDLTATAIGACVKGKLLSRRGCRPGELIVAVGDLGLFWSGFTAIQLGIPFKNHKEELLRNVLTPSPKVKVGQAIADKQLLTACIDNSDGLYPSLAQLADVNGLQMILNFEAVEFSPEVLYVSSLSGINAVRYSLGWGDWQLIGCCRPDSLDALRTVARNHSTDVSVIGKVRDGKGIILEYDGQARPMAPIDSQRFMSDSWFTVGLEAYVTTLMTGPIWANE